MEIFSGLELLFTEVYLDKYFSDREGLVKDINRFRKNDKACASFVHTDVRDYNRSSLFENINKKKSTINILIGAKKCLIKEYKMNKD